MSAVNVRSIVLNELKHVTRRQQAGMAKQAIVEFPKMIVSGIQPTGTVHLGNYFGAIKRWVDLQATDRGVFFIADLHAMTMPYEPKQLHENTMEMAATLLACGINPKKSLLYVQSSVHQHAELCWIFNCLTTMSKLSKLPQYKEKSEQVKAVSTGLFNYPILQAADVLLHKGTHVPCGEDQLQQLQLIKELARSFNKKYGEMFPIIVDMIGTDQTKRILSLRDPMKKQSKSDPIEGSRITLRDDPNAILKKIKKAMTDFTPTITYDPMTRAGVSNLINIHAQVRNVSAEQIVKDANEWDTLKFKITLAEDLIQLLNPIRLQIEDYLKNRDYLLAVLRDGRDKAAETAEHTMMEVHKKIGTIKL